MHTYTHTQTALSRSTDCNIINGYTGGHTALPDTASSADFGASVQLLHSQMVTCLVAVQLAYKQMIEWGWVFTSHMHALTSLHTHSNSHVLAASQPATC